MAVAKAQTDPKLQQGRVLRPKKPVNYLMTPLHRSRSPSSSHLFSRCSSSLEGISRLGEVDFYHFKSSLNSKEYSLENHLSANDFAKSVPKSAMKRTSPSVSVRFRRKKLVRFKQKRRSKCKDSSCSKDQSQQAVIKRSHSVKSSMSSRQASLKKKKAFLARVESQEPDIEKTCVIRSSESDDVLVSQKKSTVCSRTLTNCQTQVVSVTKLQHIGKGGFGDVSAWLILDKDGTRQRVAVKSFDPVEDGLVLARAEASVMVEFESLLSMQMLLWFVPQRPRSFPKDFPVPSIIMPLLESRNCISPSLQSLVFEHRTILPTFNWILRITVQILQTLTKLHVAGWAHGDMHAGNIMIYKKGIVLIDYSKANRKNRPYIYTLDRDPKWINRLDWIEPMAVTGRDCCSRAGDIWSLGKLVQDLIAFPGNTDFKASKKELLNQNRLNAFIHLTQHKRRFRPDAKFLIEILSVKDFSQLNLCDCKTDCEMLQR